MTEAERIEKAFLIRTSFKNVSGNWQLKGDVTPQTALRIAQEVMEAENERLQQQIKSEEEKKDRLTKSLKSVQNSRDEAYEQLKSAQELNRDLVGYVIAYKGLASLTSDEDIFIQSLINKAK